MGLVLDSWVLIAAERDARPVSELLVALEHEHAAISAARPPLLQRWITPVANRPRNRVILAIEERA
jgi:hypothetical protein